MTKIVITRPAQNTKSTIILAQRFGFEVINFPLLVLTPVNDAILNRALPEYNWILFTSSNAIRFFVDFCSAKSITIPSAIKFAAVGPTTEQTLKSFGLKADFVPDAFNRTAISMQMPVRRGEVILYPTIVDGPNQTERILKQKGCVTDRLNIYRSSACIYPDRKWQLLDEKNPQVITFFSPRTVQAFFKNKQESIDLNRYIIAVLAQSSAKELKKFGYLAHITAEIPTAQNLLQGIKKYYA